MPLKDFRSICLPYCLDRRPDGSYVVLNREYKPLGFGVNTHYEYEDYPICTAYKGITAGFATKVSWNKSSATDSIYLYNDGCIPTESAEHMAAYMQRLALLAKLEVQSVSHAEEAALKARYGKGSPMQGGAK